MKNRLAWIGGIAFVGAWLIRGLDPYGWFIEWRYQWQQRKTASPETE